MELKTVFLYINKANWAPIISDTLPPEKDVDPDKRVFIDTRKDRFRSMFVDLDYLVAFFRSKHRTTYMALKATHYQARVFEFEYKVM
jgi:hypothetical protein